jgi:hypothetical protein
VFTEHPQVQIYLLAEWFSFWHKFQSAAASKFLAGGSFANLTFLQQEE